MKYKAVKIKADPLFDAINIICKEYETKHIEAFTQKAIATHLKAEQAMSKLQKIDIEVRELNKI